MTDAVKLCECGCGQPAAKAKRTNRRLGIAIGDPLRFARHHYARTRRQGPAYIVDTDTGCWVWQWKIDHSGYGAIHLDGGWKKAHRVYYERFNGPISDGLVLDHLCRNTACVNPDHLEPVTQRENSRRGSSSKLTPHAVRVMRRLRELGWMQDDIAEVFGVHDSQVSRALRGVTWGERSAA